MSEEPSSSGAEGSKVQQPRTDSQDVKPHVRLQQHEEIPRSQGNHRTRASGDAQVTESHVDHLEKEKENRQREPDNLKDDSEAEDSDQDEVKGFDSMGVEHISLDPTVIKQQELISCSKPTTELEIALAETLKRKEAQVERLSGEVMKLKNFISKRKQTYKRKRKDESAPTRALSAYNIFVQDKFAQLAKQNEQALKSADVDQTLKRVPPASLVAKTGTMWKELSVEEKAHYEERAREDRKRYEEQMAKYQPPDKQTNRKRNKTGYNMFFSAHVLRLKQTDAGVPSERGSVARLVGDAWKKLSSDDKQYYEREADKHNGMNPIEKEEEEEDEEAKRGSLPEYATGYPMQHQEMHMHTHPPMHPAYQHPPSQHDPRQHYQYPPHHMHYHPYYAHPAEQGQGQHSRHHQSHRGYYAHGYPPPHAQRHPGYEQGGMGI